MSVFLESAIAMKFVDLPLSAPILEAVASEGYEIATPIQAQTIPHTLSGRDVLGCAQTGTGKTAAFALPMLDRLAADPAGTARKGKRKLPRALVLAPTRELAQQIAEAFGTYGKYVDIYGTVIYGGVGQGTQVVALRRGVDVVVATPGRLLDLINQGHCDLSGIKMLVLDEADRMLDMGFMPDIKKIIAQTAEKKQTLLFSATMPREIQRFADALLKNPERITIDPGAPAAERIEQRVYHVAKPDKPALLTHLMQTESISRAIVFSRTKHGADRIARHLKRTGTSAEAIHGDKTQGARKKALDRFKDGKVVALVATDIAARGIDVDNISHVVNYDLSRDAENHVHRIGRTARAGAEGIAISFCDREELPHLKNIERLIKMKIEVIGDAPPEARENRGGGGGGQRKRIKRAAHPLDKVKAGSKPRHQRKKRSAKQHDTQTAHTYREGGGGHSGKSNNTSGATKCDGGNDTNAGGEGDRPARKKFKPKGKNTGKFAPNGPKKKQFKKKKTTSVGGQKRAGGPNAGKKSIKPPKRGAGIVSKKKSS